MDPNPYESPQTGQKPSPNKPNTADNSATVLALGCLTFPASFIAFFVVCTATGEGRIGVQSSPTDWGLGPSFAAAALVAGAFIYAIVMVGSGNCLLHCHQ